MDRMSVLMLIVLMLGGCAQTPDSSPLTISSARYAEAFDTARMVLRDNRFELNRVDAAEGVIVSSAHRSAGLATPWDVDQSSFSQEAEDLLHRQQRVVRVTFERADGGSSLSAEGELVVRVGVVVQRLYQPGLRIATGALSRSSHARDPELIRRRMQPVYTVSRTKDPKLAARLVEQIRRRLNGQDKQSETSS